MLAPVDASAHRCLGGEGRLQEIERRFDDESLHHTVIGPTAGIAERKIGEDEPGHRALLDDVARAADDHRRRAGPFKLAGDQTHGLVADRSQWNEENGIQLVLLSPGVDDFGVGLREPLAVDRWNRVEPFGQFPDAALVGQRRQRL